jgi:hypothetical protein
MGKYLIMFRQTTPHGLRVEWIIKRTIYSNRKGWVVRQDGKMRRVWFTIHGLHVCGLPIAKEKPRAA